MNRTGLSSVILGCFFAVAGCGKGLQTKAAILQDPTFSPLRFSVSSQYFLTESKRDLYRAIANGESVPFGAISRAMMEDHFRNWKGRHPEDERELDEMVRGIQGLVAGAPASELGETKAAVEAKLLGAIGTPLIYNAQAISIFDALYQNRAQAYSGTLLLTLAARENWGKPKIEAANLVVIYESGHVLPGYLQKVGEEWHLIGIETAVEGTGRVLYGEVNHAMQNEDRMIRVVDAQLFALVELYKFDADDILDMANQALVQTAAKYGIREPSLLVRERFKRQVDYGKLAWSPFSFGNPDVGQGDRVRAKLMESPRKDLPRANPNLTIFHIAPAPAPTSGTIPQGEVQFLDPYPYRELADASAEGGRRFQCWDYDRKVWVDIPTKRTEDGRYAVKSHPCKKVAAGYSPYGYGGYAPPSVPQQNYEPLPYPLFVEPPKQTPRYYDPYGDSEDYEDWEE